MSENQVNKGIKVPEIKGGKNPPPASDKPNFTPPKTK